MNCLVSEKPHADTISSAWTGKKRCILKSLIEVTQGITSDFADLINNYFTSPAPLQMIIENIQFPISYSCLYVTTAYWQFTLERAIMLCFSPFQATTLTGAFQTVSK